MLLIMPEHVCEDCGYIAYSLSRLERHHKRRNKCSIGKYKCDCGHRTNDKSNLNKHKKTCKGRPKSIADREKELAEYRTVLAATGNQRNNTNQEILQNAAASSSTSLNNENNQSHSGSGDIVGRDQINNITNNITVNCAYKEDIDHIQKMTIEELKKKIGCLPDLSTHVKLFDLIRTSEDHPENNTMLLPDLNGKTVQYKTEDGWQSAPYNQRMLEAFLTDNKFLIEKIPSSHQDQIFYQGYLLGSNFRAKDDYLMPYYDACRKSLHDMTLKLAESHTDFQRASTSHSNETENKIESQASLSMMQSDIDKQIELKKLENQNELLRIERLKLQLQASASTIEV